MKARWLAFKKRHWDGRAAHERRIIASGAMILLPLLAYFLLWQPAHTANAKLRTGVPVMRAQAAHLRAQAAEAEMLHHRPRPAVFDAGALKAAVEESSTRHKVRDAITTLDVQGPNAVRITFAAVSFKKWINWMRDMQWEQHIRAESANVVALPQAGMVRINATLASGGTQ